MKQNTKFLWMYIGILFSFALILIIFAGLSRNTDTEQKEGLKADIATLSQQNTAIATENANLKNQLDALMSENNALKADDAVFADTENTLMLAAAEYDKGNKKEAKDMLASIDPLTLTQTQTYLYNMLTGK